MSEQRPTPLGIGRWLAMFVCAASLVTMGCDASNEAQGDKKHHALTIASYNYTNQYIDQLYVNGQGGSNVFVSTPDSGGGKSVCCISWTDGTPLPQMITVRWAYTTCTTQVTDSNGRTRDWYVPLFKEEQVQLTGPIPSSPGYFEVHVYPDEHAEVAITEFESDPRLSWTPRVRFDPTFHALQT